MATKKLAPAKAGKAPAKPAAKKIAKSGKSLPKKLGKSVKVAPAKKAIPKKAMAKSTPKPTGKSVSHAPVNNKSVNNKEVAKSVQGLPARPALKKAVIGKNAAKPIAKEASKKIVPLKKVPVKATNPATKIMAKKEEVKKTEAIAPVKAAPSKQAAEIKAKDIKVPAPKAIVIPKISTKTVRKYQPDFTKSVLDKTSRDPGAPTQRYSDAELLEFRELIQRKLEAAKKELSYLHGLITRKDEMGGDEGDNRYMTMEDGSLSMEREQLSQMASRQITFIDHLEKAVMRIENKTYGICRVTGKLIDKARLRAVPHATLSIEAKMGASR